MREIKFRVWSVGGKTIYNWEQMQTPSHKLYQYFWWDDMYKLMQYTGLKDKNGKEIYEGDIVFSSFRRKDEEIYEVKWMTKSAEFSIQNQAICERDLEVIGNIYENPELLKNK